MTAPNGFHWTPSLKRLARAYEKYRSAYLADDYNIYGAAWPLRAKYRVAAIKCSRCAPETILHVENMVDDRLKDEGVLR